MSRFMRLGSGKALAIGLVATVLAEGRLVMTLSRSGLSDAVDDSFAKEIEAWRAKHEADYRRDWVSIEGLFFLKPGSNRAGSDPAGDIVLSDKVPAVIGSFALQDHQVAFTPDARVPALLGGQPVTKTVVLNPDSGPTPPDELIINGVRLTVHASGDRLAVRARDEHGRMAQAFRGFHWFPIDRRYRVVGRFIRDPQPHEVRLPNILGDEETYTTEGVAEFTLEGQTMRMRPMTTRAGRLYFIFKDASSGRETYATARFLYADVRPDGTTILDFNEAYNPPCAFNPYTTCPIPPRENRLTVRILAGERDYPHGPAGSDTSE